MLIFSSRIQFTKVAPPITGERDDSLVGKTVRIQAGQWKGYLGTVSLTTATHVQVELHSRLKKVMVVKERVHVVGDKFGATENLEGSNGLSGSSTTPFMGGITPMHHGGETPMHGGATPMHGGATPMHDGYGCVHLTQCCYLLTHYQMLKLVLCVRLCYDT